MRTDGPDLTDQLAQDAAYLAWLGVLRRPQLVAELEDLGRLDEDGAARSRFVVHDAADAGPRGGANGDHIAATAHGNSGVGRALALVEASQDRSQPVDDALPRLAHALACPGEVARRAVEHLAVRRNRLHELRLQLLGRRVGTQSSSARCV